MRGVVTQDLPIEFTEDRLTSYAASFGIIDTIVGGGLISGATSRSTMMRFLPKRIPAAEEVRLAVGFSDDLLLRRALFILGLPILFVVSAWFGNTHILKAYFLATARWAPLTVLCGALLSLLDTRQTRRNLSAYAEIEKARRSAARLSSFKAMGEYYRVGRRYRRAVVLQSMAALVPVVIFGVLGGLFGGTLLLAITFGTECVCWRLLWRPRLLERASTASAGGSTYNP